MLNSSRRICSKLVYSSSVRYLANSNQNSWLNKIAISPYSSNVKRSLGSISFGSNLINEKKQFNENSNKPNSAKIFLFLCGVFGLFWFSLLLT